MERWYNNNTPFCAPRVHNLCDTSRVICVHKCVPLIQVPFVDLQICADRCFEGLNVRMSWMSDVNLSGCIFGCLYYILNTYSQTHVGIMIEFMNVSKIISWKNEILGQIYFFNLWFITPKFVKNSYNYKMNINETLTELFLFLSTSAATKLRTKFTVDTTAVSEWRSSV